MCEMRRVVLLRGDGSSGEGGGVEEEELGLVRRKVRGDLW